MKKFLSLALVLVMVMSLSIPAFADKPAWAANQKENDEGEEIEIELPKGLQKKDVIPYGHRKDQEVSVEDIEQLIEEVLDYIDGIDVDADDGLDDGTGDEDEDLENEIIDLHEAEEIALGSRDASIVEMSFDGEDYEFVIWYADKEFEVEVDGVTGDRDVESEDLEYDLEDVISYDDAKAIALDEVDEDDGMVIKLELELEEVDEGEDSEGIYKVEVKTEDMIYEVEIDAYSGDVLDTDSEVIEEDEDSDWDRDRDRDRDRDGDEDMVSAIYNLIDRIEYEIEMNEEDAKLVHYMFQLEQKFSVLQKIYGEKEEKEDYTEDLDTLQASLEDIKDNAIFTEKEQDEIQDLIDEIEAAVTGLEDEEFITEDQYEDFEDDAEAYLDMLDEVVEEDDVAALVDEVKDFIFENDFGSDVGEYSQNEAIALMTLVFEYDAFEDEDLEDYYNDLKRAFKKFKMSKLVADSYLEMLLDYRDDLNELEDEDLTEAEEDLRDDLIALINRVENAGKMRLGTFYDIEEDILTLIEVVEEDSTVDEEALDELINNVRNSVLMSYEDIKDQEDQEDLKDEKLTLLGKYFVALASRDNAENQQDFVDAYEDLEAAYGAFLDFLESVK